MPEAFIKTPLGTARIVGDEQGISVISILDAEHGVSYEISIELAEAVAQIEEYFSGKRNDFTFPINPSGTDFQQKVWQELLNIPFGKTMSYLELSKKLGDVKAI